MKLVIKNLGAIKKKSEIDLTKRFYTFVGYNNSGKTYVSQVIWYLFSELRNNFFIESELPSIVTKKDINNNFETFEYDIKSLYYEYKLFLTKKVKELLGIENTDTILIEIEDYLQNTSYQMMYVAVNRDNLALNCYVISKIELSYKIKIKYITLESPQSLEKLKEIFNIDTTFVIPFSEKDVVNTNWGGTYLSIFFRYIFTRVHNRNTIFLPSSRTFLPSYHKYLSKGYEQERKEIGEIVRKNPEDIEKVKFLTKKRHTSAVDSVLDKLNSLSSKSKIKPFYADLLLDLEKLMQGSIGVENVEGIANSEFGFKVDEKTTLEMYQTSTSVNQLTLLYLYLKYWAEESNNFLIIDEPEENLHPENQIKLLDILVRFANRNNNRVLFTTHSPLMAEAVNNHAHISLLRERGEDIEKIIANHHLTITPNDTLKHSDYATYFFNGEAIKEYPMTDFGVFFRDFKEAEDKVRNTANILKDYIYQTQNQAENGKENS